MSKHGWNYKTIGEVCNFYRGLTYKGKDEVDFSSNVVLRSNNVDLDTYTLNLEDLKYINEDITIPEDKFVKKNSLLICMSNGSKQHLGKVAFIDKDYPYAFGGFMGLIKPFESEISPKFVYYYCCSPQYKNFLLRICNGANINNLRFSDIAKNMIPLPGMAEQEAIVAELDEINEAIAALQQQVADLDTLAQSTFYDMFGDPVTNPKAWPVKKLGEVATSKIGLTYKPTDVNEDGIVVLRSGNIQNSIIDLNDLVRVQARVPEDKIVRKNDILMCTRNGSFRLVGKVALIGDLEEKMTYGAFMTVIRSEYYNYLFNFFKSPAYRVQLGSAGTSTINQITVKMLNDLMLPIPPLALQQEFAEKVEAIEEAKAELNAQIAEMQTLLASRMDYYFD